MRRKGLGVSPITNTIFYGTLDTEKHMWIGQKTDITDDAIRAVYQWFMANMDGNEEYTITYPSTTTKIAVLNPSGLVVKVGHIPVPSTVLLKAFMVYPP